MAFALAAISILQIVDDRLDHEFSSTRRAFAIVGATVLDDIGIMSVISIVAFPPAALALGQEVHKTRSYAVRKEEQARKNETLRNQELEEDYRPNEFGSRTSCTTSWVTR